MRNRIAFAVFVSPNFFELDVGFPIVSCGVLYEVVGSQLRHPKFG